MQDATTLLLRLSLPYLITRFKTNQYVHSSQTNMGSCTGQRCQGGLPSILCPRHGRPYKAQVSVARYFLFPRISRLTSYIYFSQPGQTSSAEVKKKDLRAELLLAEEEARNKKRKAEGRPPLAVNDGGIDEEANKRRKLLQDALDLDKDDDEEDGDENDKEDEDKDKESEEDSDDDEDEDDTAELLRELEKIKRERAEEKERQEMEQSATQAAAREIEVATANPLLNLAAQLGQSTPGGVNTTVPGTFAVKRRWDDGMPPF